MLKIIEGGAKFKPVVSCPVCGGRTFVDVYHLLRRDGKKITRGVKARACLACVASGKTTLL